MRDYTAAEAAAAENPAMNDVQVELDGTYTSLRSGYGLWLQKQSPQIGAPEVEGEQAYPPGYDFVLDFTQGVDGKVHFKQRNVSLSFLCLRPKEQWESIRSALETALQGQWLRFYCSRAPEIIREGQFAVELTPGQNSASVTIDVTCAP